MRQFVVSLIALAVAAPGTASAQAPASAPSTPAPRESVGPDVPPELPASVYRKRREELLGRLGTCAGLLRSEPASGRYSETPFDPDFYYLTGLVDEGAILLLSPRDEIKRQSLYLQPRDPESEVWEGYREPMSLDLRKKYQMDDVRRIRGGRIRDLGTALRRSRCLAVLRPEFMGQPPLPADMLRKYLTAFNARTVQKWEEVEHMRAVKDAEEIKRMEKAIAITFKGHEAAARALRAGVIEREVAARLEAAFFAHGATGLAFPSIVGAGKNGAILHWEKRTGVVGANDLVVVDIGASYGGYAADITRTYPVSGTFSDEQRKAYEVVLSVQNTVIAAVRPGVSIDRLHQIAERELAKAGYEMPHGIGHFVGLEVHDVGDRGGPLEAGMVITVEPGVYIQDRFGIRIEDEVLVTPRGHRLLSGDLPRKPAEVEAWMKKIRAAQ